MASDGNNNEAKGQCEMKLFRLDKQEFLATMKVEATGIEKNENIVQFVIILDKSGSMGSEAARLLNVIFPNFLGKLNYQPTQPVHLISFDDSARLDTPEVQAMKTMYTKGDGGTNLAPAIQMFQKVVEQMGDEAPLRLLTISDGEIYDYDATEKAAAALMESLKGTRLTINAQAVRLFTSASQPETTALCHLLQLNNLTRSQIVDISVSETNEEISTKIADLFKDDLEGALPITFNKDVILPVPWQTTPVSKLNLTPGDNVFWVQGDTSQFNPTIAGASVKVVQKNAPTLLQFQKLMDPKMDYIIDHMKILKVLGTDEAQATIGKMIEYFDDKETKLAAQSPLAKIAKLMQLEWTDDKQITNVLTSVAKDDSVKDMDAAGKAEYLQKIENSWKIDNNTSWTELFADKLNSNEIYVAIATIGIVTYLFIFCL